MRYRIEISEKAKFQHIAAKIVAHGFHSLPNVPAHFLGERPQLFAKRKRKSYRLRVGTFRVLFVPAGDAIQVYAVKDRKQAYE